MIFCQGFFTGKNHPLGKMKSFSKALLPTSTGHMCGVSQRQGLVRWCGFPPHPTPRRSLQTGLWTVDRQRRSEAGVGRSELSVVLEEGSARPDGAFPPFPENDAPCPDRGETQADLPSDLDGSGEQDGEVALPKEVVQLEGEEVEASRSQTDCEEEAVESDPRALDGDFQCPRAEDTVQMPGSPGCKTCRYLLVQSPTTFSCAQVSGRAATVERDQGKKRVDSTFCSLFIETRFPKPSVLDQNLLGVR